MPAGAVAVARANGPARSACYRRPRVGLIPVEVVAEETAEFQNTFTTSPPLQPDSRSVLGRSRVRVSGLEIRVPGLESLKKSDPLLFFDLIRRTRLRVRVRVRVRVRRRGLNDWQLMSRLRGCTCVWGVTGGHEFVIYSYIYVQSTIHYYCLHKHTEGCLGILVRVHHLNEMRRDLPEDAQSAS